ncbi:DUF2345 domain-containing protein, partial [Gilliamella sp. B3464]|uniref:DUF2345 domain-containing protein n=1 Tax=unclassified Gilliamella TaxID=2685620 RepID=UPI00226AE103
ANLTELAQSGILAYAQEGMALTSPENIQLSTSSSISLTSENQTDITALKNITLSGGESLGLFAHKSGMKVFANQGGYKPASAKCQPEYGRQTGYQN